MTTVVAGTSEFQDITVTAPANAAIISWSVENTFTTGDDLIIQAAMVATDTMRVTFFNPTGGNINPNSFDMVFVIGEPRIGLGL